MVSVYFSLPKDVIHNFKNRISLNVCDCTFRFWRESVVRQEWLVEWFNVKFVQFINEKPEDRTCWGLVADRDPDTLCDVVVPARCSSDGSLAPMTSIGQFSKNMWALSWIESRAFLSGECCTDVGFSVFSLSHTLKKLVEYHISAAWTIRV